MPNIAWSETSALAKAVDDLYNSKMASTPNGGSGQGPGGVYAAVNTPSYKGRGDLPSKYAGYTGSTYYTGIPKFMGNVAEPYNIQNGKIHYFYQTFKFAYYEGPEYDAYERYRGEKGDIPKGPLLISMFCANQHGYYEAGDRFANISDSIGAVSGNNVANLCEAEYDKLKCWWDGLETYAKTPTTACEIYFRSQSSPCVFYRVALASNSPSGNGNGSHFMYGKPYPPGGISDSLEMNEHFTLQEVAFNQIYPPHRNPTSVFYPPPPLCTCKSPNFPNLGAESGMYADSIGTSAFPGNPSQDMIDESKLRPMAQVTDLHMNFGKIYPDSSDPQVLASRLSQGFVFASDVASYNHGNNGTITYTNQHLNSVIQAQTKLIFVTGRGSTPTYHFIEAPTCLSIAISAQVVVAIRKRWYDYIYQKIRFIAGAWYEDIGFPIGTTYDRYTGALGAMLSPCARMQRELKDPLKSGFKSSAASDNDFLGERYFEQWLCDHNAQYDTEGCSYTASCPGSSSSSGFNEQAGGFGSNAEKYSMLNDATCQKEVVLPWQGGCSNTSCEGWPSVHKYTIDSLNKIITTLNQEKLSEQQLTSSGRIVTLQDGPFPGITQGGGKWVACSRSWVGVFAAASSVCGGVAKGATTCGGTTEASSHYQLDQYLGSSLYNVSVSYNQLNISKSKGTPRFHYYDKGYATPCFPKIDSGAIKWDSSSNYTSVYQSSKEKFTQVAGGEVYPGVYPGATEGAQYTQQTPIDYCKVGYGLNFYPRWLDSFQCQGTVLRYQTGTQQKTVYGCQLGSAASISGNAYAEPYGVGSPISNHRWYAISHVACGIPSDNQGTYAFQLDNYNMYPKQFDASSNPSIPLYTTVYDEKNSTGIAYAVGRDLNLPASVIKKNEETWFYSTFGACNGLALLNGFQQEDFAEAVTTYDASQIRPSGSNPCPPQGWPWGPPCENPLPGQQGPDIDHACQIESTTLIQADNRTYDKDFTTYKLSSSSATTATISSASGSANLRPSTQTPCKPNSSGVPPEGVPLLVTLESESTEPMTIKVQPSSPEDAKQGSNPESFDIKLGRGGTAAAFIMIYGGWEVDSSDCKFQGGQSSPCRGTASLRATSDGDPPCGSQGKTKVTIRATPYLGQVYGTTQEYKTLSDDGAKLGCYGENCPLMITSGSGTSATCTLTIPGMGIASGLLFIEVLAPKSSSIRVNVSGITLKDKKGYLPSDIKVWKDIHGGGCMRYFLEDLISPNSSIAGLSDDGKPYYSFADDGQHIQLDHISQMYGSGGTASSPVNSGYGANCTGSQPSPGMMSVNMGYWERDTSADFSQYVAYKTATESENNININNNYTSQSWELNFGKITSLKNPGKAYYLGKSDPGLTACSSPSYYYGTTQPSPIQNEPVPSRSLQQVGSSNQSMCGSLSAELWMGPCKSDGMTMVNEQEARFASDSVSPESMNFTASMGQCKQYNSQYRTLLCLKVEGRATGSGAATFARNVAMSRNAGFAPVKSFDSYTGKSSGEVNWMTDKRIIETVVQFKVQVSGVS